MKKRWKRTGILLACSVMLLTSGCSLVATGEDPKPELLKPVKDKVELLEVKKGSIVNEINGVGTAVPRSTTYASFTIDGRIHQILVKAGDRVNKGDVLMRLDTGTLNTDILNQQIKVEKTKIDMDKAKNDGTEDQIRIAVMSVDVEVTRLNDFLKKRSQLELLAPISGIVNFIDPSVAPNSTITGYRDLIGIIDPNDTQIRYLAPDASSISQVQLGMEAIITSGGKTWKANVTQTPATAPAASSSTQSDKNTKTLLFDLVDGMNGVTFGENVNINLVINRKDNVIKIPRVALRSYQGRSFVHIMDGEMRKEIDVERGLVSPTEVEITKGLKEGMQVILNN